ncbi:hypothetical protein [Bradyrhizobium lablabi]|uniref:hypothetical protein n=1 Tax=Bradyrhizobium lablabi TaxID=722472 RepID=UPI00090CD665|nr:hypothetical protein [Bradyrhizobium lablabi]SHM40746.1 hypothetical protein SAMN05444321_6241 [Bradyrhizobium lablabi]
MNRINRTGRGALLAMAAILLAGCFQSVLTVRDEMNALKGKPINVAIAKLGIPTNEQTIAGQKVYTWETGTIAGGDQYRCRIRVVMAGNVIGSYEGEGDAGSCEEYAQKLKS